jgi:phenylalanyl-tRNA synthetase beta subunit
VIAEALNIKYELTDTEHGSLIRGRNARVIVNGAKIAYIGEVHPQVLSNWTIDMPVAILEMNVTELFRLLHHPGEAIEEEKLIQGSEKKNVKIISKIHTSHVNHKPAKKKASKSKSKR